MRYFIKFTFIFGPVGEQQVHFYADLIGTQSFLAYANYLNSLLKEAEEIETKQVKIDNYYKVLKACKLSERELVITIEDENEKEYLSFNMRDFMVEENQPKIIEKLNSFVPKIEEEEEEEKEDEEEEKDDDEEKEKRKKVPPPIPKKIVKKR